MLDDDIALFMHAFPDADDRELEILPSPNSKQAQNLSA
jgi:hypothetical protein